jgi:hypothetical protein
MDDQQIHDLKMSKQKVVSSKSKQVLIDLLKKKEIKRLKKVNINDLDPISCSMLDHPGLTRSEALEFAESFGF